MNLTNPEIAILELGDGLDSLIEHKVLGFHIDLERVWQIYYSGTHHSVARRYSKNAEYISRTHSSRSLS